jgi:hypothetical protein
VHHFPSIRQQKCTPLPLLYENFEKGMIYMKILKKGGGEETKFMPHAPVVFCIEGILNDLLKRAKSATYEALNH